MFTMFMPKAEHPATITVKTDMHDKVGWETAVVRDPPDSRMQHK